ncbi:hypothetical protein FOPG_16903, partial [Fusarium oxysporum f. sp. conglutinans race 2 54008]
MVVVEKVANFLISDAKSMGTGRSVGAGAAVSVFDAKMDATGDVILVQGGGSVAATRQISRTMKRTANLQERLQEKSQAVGERADAVVTPLHGGAGGESELADKAGKSQMLEDASGNNVSLMRTMLRAMLHETSTQLMDEQKKMLERLW